MKRKEIGVFETALEEPCKNCDKFEPIGTLTRKQCISAKCKNECTVKCKNSGICNAVLAMVR